MQKIMAEESVQLEITNTNQSQKPINANQKEIIATKEEIEQQKYLYETFQNAKIQITIPEIKRKDQAVIEIKCPACFCKSYTAKSHNQHMKNCVVNVLKLFFSEFQSLYSNRCTKKITEKEYVFYAISLIFNYVKQIEKIAKKDKINIEAVTKIPPPDYALTTVKQPNNNYQQQSTMPNQRTNNNSMQANRFNSPDNGYYSNPNQ